MTRLCEWRDCFRAVSGAQLNHSSRRGKWLGRLCCKAVEAEQDRQAFGEEKLFILGAGEMSEDPNGPLNSTPTVHRMCSAHRHFTIVTYVALNQSVVARHCCRSDPEQLHVEQTH